MYKKVISFLLVLCMLFSIVPFGGTALAADGTDADPYEVYSQADLISTLTEIEKTDNQTADFKIVVKDNFFLSQTISFPKDRNIILCSEINQKPTITASGELAASGGAMFVLPAYDTPATTRVRICGLTLDADASNKEPRSTNVRIIDVNANARFEVGWFGYPTTLRNAYISGASNGGAAIRAGTGSIVYSFHVD